LFVAGVTLQRHGDAVRDEQELLMQISNMVMEIYAMDTALCRVKRKPSSGIHRDVVRTFINDAMSRVEMSARQVLASVSEGDLLRAHLSALRRLIRWAPIDTIRARQRVAEYLIDQNRYLL
jgi:hypothetical protein